MCSVILAFATDCFSRDENFIQWLGAPRILLSSVRWELHNDCTSRLADCRSVEVVYMPWPACLQLHTELLRDSCVNTDSLGDTAYPFGLILAPPLTCLLQRMLYAGNEKQNDRWWDSAYDMTLPVYMLQETLFSPLLKQLWYHNLKK